MAKFEGKKYWWIEIMVLVILAVVAKVIVDRWMPEAQLLGAALFLGLIGASFYLVYADNKERLWWVVIPGLGAFTLLAAVISDALIGTDPANDWINVLVIGAGAMIIAAVLKPINAKIVLQS